MEDIEKALCMHCHFIYMVWCFIACVVNLILQMRTLIQSVKGFHDIVAFLKKVLLMYVYVCACVYVSVCHIRVGAFWGQERHWVPWSWGSLLLWTSWCSAGNSCLSSWTTGSTHLLGHLSSLVSDQTSVCYDWETSWVTKNLEVYLLQQADRTQVDVLMLPTYIVLGRTFCQGRAVVSVTDLCLSL